MNGSYLQQKGFDTLMWIWNEVHPAPFEAARAIGFFAYPIIKNSLKRRLPKMKEEVIEVFAKYVH